MVTAGVEEASLSHTAEVHTCLRARDLCYIAHHGSYIARHSPPDCLVRYLRCVFTGAMSRKVTAQV
jgi:hypothetical protein